MLNSLEYLFAMLSEQGGIQMEAGDSGMCMCESCRLRRTAGGGGEQRLPSLSLSDMADIYLTIL